MRSLPCLLILLNLGLLSACDDDPAPGGSLDSGTLDAGPGDPDASNDGLRDASGEGPDAGSDGGPDGGSGCLYPGDCPGGDCLEGECVYDPPARCEGGDPAPCAPGELCDDPALGGYCALPCELYGTCPRRPQIHSASTAQAGSDRAARAAARRASRAASRGAAPWITGWARSRPPMASTSPREMSGRIAASSQRGSSQGASSQGASSQGASGPGDITARGRART